MTKWSLNRGDLWIQVVTRTGFTVLTYRVFTLRVSKIFGQRWLTEYLMVAALELVGRTQTTEDEGQKQGTYYLRVWGIDTSSL